MRVRAEPHSIDVLALQLDPGLDQVRCEHIAGQQVRHGPDHAGQVRVVDGVLHVEVGRDGAPAVVADEPVAARVQDVEVLAPVVVRARAGDRVAVGVGADVDALVGIAVIVVLGLLALWALIVVVWAMVGD